MCSVSTFGRACLTLPCSLLRVRQIQSPWQPQQVTQAWSGLRNCPLTFSKRKKSHQLLVIAKTLSTDFTFTTEHLTVMIARHSKILSCLSKIQRPILSKGLSTSRSPHQVSTGLAGMEDVCVKRGGSPQQQGHHSRASWSPPDRSQVSSLMDYLDFCCSGRQEGHLKKVIYFPSLCIPTWQG